MSPLLQRCMVSSLPICLFPAPQKAGLQPLYTPLCTPTGGRIQLPFRSHHPTTPSVPLLSRRLTGARHTGPFLRDQCLDAERALADKTICVVPVPISSFAIQSLYQEVPGKHFVYVFQSAMRINQHTYPEVNNAQVLMSHTQKT